MRGWGILWRLARADVLERVRRYSFLIALAASLWLLYLALTGQLKMYLGDYRGVYNSAWAGLLMALSAGTFVSLAGFYVVKGSVERDRRTGVGQILAATRIRKTTYLLSKFLSNLSVLSAILAVLGIAAIVLQAVHGEISTVNPWQLLSPLLLLALPTMAMVAAVAVFFETISWLRGGFGNVVYFFLWNLVLVIPIANDWAQVDLLGLRIAEEILQEAASSRFPDYNGNFAFGLGPNVDLSQKQTFIWEGLPWNAPLMQNRLTWMLLAVLLVVLGSVWFDRFDPSTSPLRRASHTGARMSMAISPLARILQPPLRILQWRRTGVMVAAELRITLNGISTWWYVVLIALFLVALFSPLNIAKQSQVYIWIWPILVWSKLGTRERRYKTDQVLFSAPQPIRRQLLATWLASVIFTIATALPVFLRLLLAGEVRDPVALCCGAVFIPTLALAAGVWSQSSKLFEAVYLVWWYLGPVHALAPLDFTGIVSDATGWTLPLSYAAATVGLLWLAVWGRRIQLSRM